MLTVYDFENDVIYAEGENLDELITSWNENSKEKLSWLLDDSAMGDQDTYKELTDEVYRLENLQDVISEINQIEVNDLKICEKQGDKYLPIDNL